MLFCRDSHDDFGFRLAQDVPEFSIISSDLHKVKIKCKFIGLLGFFHFACICKLVNKGSR